MILNILAVVLIAAGLLFFLGAVVGLIRFPDFYSRMHAAGKGDTLSTVLIAAGVVLLLGKDGFIASELLISVKILSICVFIMITSPTSTHALTQAAYEDGIKPQQPEEPEKNGKSGTAPDGSRHR